VYASNYNRFRDDKLEDLARMYDLFARMPHTLDELRTAMCEVRA
jgi:hypothetical protein